MDENLNSKWQIFAWSGDFGETLMCHNSRKVMNEIFKFSCLSYLNNSYNL